MGAGGYTHSSLPVGCGGGSSPPPVPADPENPVLPEKPSPPDPTLGTPAEPPVPAGPPPPSPDPFPPESRLSGAEQPNSAATNAMPPASTHRNRKAPNASDVLRAPPIRADCPACRTVLDARNSLPSAFSAHSWTLVTRFPFLAPPKPTFSYHGQLLVALSAQVKTLSQMTTGAGSAGRPVGDRILTRAHGGIAQS